MSRLLVIVILVLSACAEPQSADIAIRQVTLVDVASGLLVPDQTVLIAGRRIVAVGPTEDLRIAPDANLVDGAGGYLIPGLWDMHVHSVSNVTVDVTIAVLTNTIRTGSDALVVLGEVAAKVLDLDTASPMGSATSDATLQPYVGVYRGGRGGTRYEVSVEAGQLQISPSGSETGASFTYLGDHTFAMVDGDYPLDRYVFHVRDGVARAYSAYYNGMHGAFRQRVGP